MKKTVISLIIIISVLCLTGLEINNVEAAVCDYEGYILLDVERHGEAYYIFQGEKYYLGRPNDAFDIMRQLSLGISEENFQSGFRQVNDIWQIYRVVNSALYPHIAGRIVIRPHANGEAYYVDPGIAPDGYSAKYLGRPYDAFIIMTEYGGGAHSSTIDSIPDGSLI